MLDCQDGIELQEGSYSAIAVDRPRSRTRLGELEWGRATHPLASGPHPYAPYDNFWIYVKVHKKLRDLLTVLCRSGTHL